MTNEIRKGKGRIAFCGGVATFVIWILSFLRILSLVIRICEARCWPRARAFERPRRVAASPQHGRMVLEPALGGFVTGANALHFAPESGGVVHFAEVGQLMEDQVIADKGGGLNQPPVQRNRSLARGR